MSQTKSSFISRNLVTVVMIPTLIGIHLGWSYMQYNRTLVKEHEQIDAPPVTFARFVWHKLTATTNSQTEKDANISSSSK